jgi:hypothetical protein
LRTRRVRVRLSGMPLARTLRGGLAVLTLALATGCVNATPPSGGRVQLVSDLADRLERAAGLTYTAVYGLPGGAQATVSQAQDPARSAYRYPGGALIVTPESTATCTDDTCALTAAPAPGADPLSGGVTMRGLVAPAMVGALLTAAAMDGDALVTTHDTTLAGRSATCVQIGGVGTTAVSDFEVCVTMEGVLASFDGVIGGVPIDIHLDRYESTVAPDAFDLPAGATVVDHRGR